MILSNLASINFNFQKDESDLLGRLVPHRSKRMGDVGNNNQLKPQNNQVKI